MEKRRVIGLDMIRTIAIILVFVTHAIAYRGVLNSNTLSWKWTIYMIIRFTAMSCVPLFLLLTLNRFISEVIHALIKDINFFIIFPLIP